MNHNIRIAKQLVRIARILVAFNRNELEKQLKRKRSDLNEKSFNEHLDCLEKMDAKEQKVALHWINKKRLILPEDLSKFQDAMNLINKQHLDFQKFEGPMEVINRDDKSTLRIRSQDEVFNPATEKTFSHPYNAGDGVVIYDVEDSKEGQLAVRKAIDVNWGYDKNPWCLATRQNSSVDDALAAAWRYWNHYKAYPKRIAFKSGKLLAFSAGDNKQHVEWWDKDDKSHYDIPESNAVDDVEFLKKHGKINLLDNKNVSPEIIEELAENEDMIVRRAVAENPKTPVKLLRKLTGDRDLAVRRNVALNTSTPVDILMKLAEDEEKWVRFAVARNPNAPAEILRKLTEDEYEQVRWGVASNPNTPAEALMKLTEDGNWVVRREIVENPKTPVEALRKLTEDEYVDVRQKIAKNPNAPADILRKLADDEDRSVRQGVAENPNAPVDILKKLAEDEEMWVRAVAEEKFQKRNSKQ